MSRPLSSCLRLALASLLFVAVLATPAHADSVVRRTFGPDRVSTAVEASRDYRERATDALLTTAATFPDALAAGALAHRLDAPLLLTHSEQLPTPVTDELARLGVRTVWILGGEGAVSAAVQAELRGLGYQVRRLAGVSRYETAREIARAAGPSATGEVVLALGEHDDPDRAWPDAVASGALAATPDRVPTLLTRPDTLPAATVEALEALMADEVIILGSEQVITPTVENRLVDLGYTTRRVVGASRYDTSAFLAEEALARFAADSQPAVFASGRAFPDALSAGSLAASLGAPLMLVPPESQLPEYSEQVLRAHADRLTEGVVIGGPAAADEFVLAQLDAALQNAPAPQPEAAPEPEPEAAEPPAEPDDGVLATYEGEASWYGPGFHGRQTANGETFDQYAHTAAHRTLPFDSIVRVTNLANGRQVEVRINDRGPVSQDRILDLAQGAAEHLQMIDDGVATIRMEVLSYG